MGGGVAGGESVNAAAGGIVWQSFSAGGCAKVGSWLGGEADGSLAMGISRPCRCNGTDADQHTVMPRPTPQLILRPRQTRKGSFWFLVVFSNIAFSAFVFSWRVTGLVVVKAWGSGNYGQ
jgi:hypothetical protein